MLLFSNLRQNWVSSSLLSVTLLGSLALGATEAKAISFTDTYAPNNWTTAQTATGTVDQTISKLTMTFQSGSQDSYIDRIITIAPTGAGKLTFNWNFVSQETANIQSVGYVLNNAYTVLANSSGNLDPDFNPIPQSGTGTVNVAEADTFAFRIQAEADSSSGGEYSITNFDATPVPWETDALPVVGTTLLFGIGIWTKGKLVNKNK